MGAMEGGYGYTGSRYVRDEEEEPKPWCSKDTLILSAILSFCFGVGMGGVALMLFAFVSVVELVR